MENREWLEDLFKKEVEIKYKTGEVLHTSDDICNSMGRVISGSVKICRVLPSGKEIILKEHFSGESYGELIVFANRHYPGWIIAKEETIVKEISKNTLLLNLQERGNLEAFLAGMFQKNLALTNKIEMLSFKTVKQKLLFLLTKDESLTLRDLNITNLAVTIGCSREALSRAISDLVSDGIVLHQGNTLKVINDELLDQLFM